MPAACVLLNDDLLSRGSVCPHLSGCSRDSPGNPEDTGTPSEVSKSHGAIRAVDWKQVQGKDG